MKNYQGKIYFNYMKNPPIIYKSKGGKGKYHNIKWGNSIHHEDGKFRNLENFKISLGIPDYLNKIKSWIRDELKNDFSESELDLLFERDNIILDNLLDQWRKSFDISIYHDPYYIFETVNCGIFVTGKLNKSDDKNMGLGSPIWNSLSYLENINYSPKSILDFGSGIGISSIYFSIQFPESDIYIIEENPLSIKIIKRLIKELGIKNIHFGDQLENYDLGLFFESVEHIKDLSRDEENIGSPFPFMDNYFNRINDLIIQSSYWKKNRSSIGHFDRYDFGDGIIEEDKKGKWGLDFRKKMEKDYNFKKDQKIKFFQTFPHFYWKNK